MKKAKKAAKVPRTYHLHRERQRRRLLAAAAELFDERGIDRTTMSEIVSASGLQPSTLYEYFANKDEIVWAIFSDILEQEVGSMKGRIEVATTGLAKITALLDSMTDQLSHHPAKVRFMAQFDAMYARDWPVERLLELEGQQNEQGFQVFEALIREGIADGSLRADLDPELALHAVMNAALGAQRRLGSMGSKVETEYGQPIGRLFQEIVRILLLGLSSSGVSEDAGPASRTTTRQRTTRKRTS